MLHNLDCKPSPIGIFDSGVGGLVVMKQLIHHLPKENFIYFADTDRLPYGEKSRKTIIRYSIENAVFLLEKNIKLLVIACNTATAHAFDKLSQIFKVPIVGTIEPSVEQAIQATQNGCIAVLGTKGTIQSECYQKAILKRMPSAYVLPLACPLLVPLVEEQYFHHPATKLIVQEYLKPIKEQGIDTVLLGCTHYPLLRHLIEEEVGDKVKIIDSALSCANSVSMLLNKQQLGYEGLTPPKHEYFVSDDAVKFQNRGKIFLGISIDNVQSIHISEVPPF